jgi:hypothetical protein
VYRVRGTEIFPAYGATARLTVAVWLSEPEEPVKVNKVVNDDRYVAAVNVSCTGCPGVAWGFAGETVTPDGSFVIPIATDEVNPFRPVTVTEAVAGVPATTLRLVLETERLKSGLGGGGDD